MCCMLTHFKNLNSVNLKKYICISITYNFCYIKKTIKRVMNFFNEVGLVGVGPNLMLVVIKMLLLLISK